MLIHHIKQKFYSTGNKKTLTKWLGSYLLLLFVSISIFILLYVQADRSWKDEINRSYQNSSEQSISIIENKLEFIQQLAIQIGRDPQIKDYCSARPREEFAYYNYRDLMQMLQKYKPYSNLVEEIYLYPEAVYNPKNQVILSTGTMPASDFEELCDSFGNILHRNQGMKDSFFPVIKKESNGAEIECIAYGISLPIEVSMPRMGKLFLLCQKDKIFSGGNQNMVARLGVLSENELIFGDTTLFGNQNYFSEGSENQDTVQKINGCKYMVRVATSKLADWRYVYMIPQEILFGKYTNITYLLFFGIFIILIIGMAFSVYVSRRNYKPIERILKTAGTYSVKTKNEFDYIDTVISQMKQQKQQMETQIEESQKFLQSVFLRRAVQGLYDPKQNITEILQKQKIYFKFHNFLVAIFYLEDFTNLFPPPLEQYSKDPQEMTLYAIRNVSEEMLSERFECYVYSERDSLVYVVDFEHEKEKNMFYHRLQEVHQVILDTLYVEVTAIVSNVYHDVSAIAEAYKECKKIYENRFFYQGKCVICEMEQIASRTEPISIEIPVNRLVNLIQIGEIEQCTQYTDELFKNIEGSNITLHQLKSSIYDLITAIILHIPQEAFDAICYSKNEFINETLECSNVVSLRGQIQRVVGALAQYFSMKNTGNASMGDQIISFINEHYSDPAFSSIMIGEHFGKSPAYISQLFRKDTGVTLNEYLIQFKVEKAKDLLKQGMSVKQVAETLGYTSPTAFGRAFKNVEGVTPNDYKRTHA